MRRLLAIARQSFTDPLALTELFLIGNVSFLAVDVAVAHAVNDFERPVEWAPVAFSLVSATMLIAAAFLAGNIRPPLPPGAVDPRRVAGMRLKIAWLLGLAAGFCAVFVGLAGLILHLQSSFFQQATLRNLVYAAPFAAPLSYAGLGLLAILNRTLPENKDWARWIIFLTLGGFLGNFILSLADHAQNGFYDRREWIAVIAAAFAVGGLLAALIDYGNRPYLRLCAGLMIVEVLAGLLGWYFHIEAIFRNSMVGLWDKIVYGAPVFAPLLFADLAILGLLGIWKLLIPHTGESDREREA